MPYAVFDRETGRPYLNNRSFPSKEMAEAMRSELLRYHQPPNEWCDRLVILKIDTDLKPPVMSEGDQRINNGRKKGCFNPKKNEKYRTTGVQPSARLWSRYG